MQDGDVDGNNDDILPSLLHVFKHNKFTNIAEKLTEGSQNKIKEKYSQWNQESRFSGAENRMERKEKNWQRPFFYGFFPSQAQLTKGETCEEKKYM